MTYKTLKEYNEWARRAGLASNRCKPIFGNLDYIGPDPDFTEVVSYEIQRAFTKERIDAMFSMDFDMYWDGKDKK